MCSSLELSNAQFNLKAASLTNDSLNKEIRVQRVMTRLTYLIFHIIKVFFLANAFTWNVKFLKWVNNEHSELFYSLN